LFPNPEDQKRAARQGDEIARAVGEPHSHERVPPGRRNEFGDAAGKGDDGMPGKLESQDSGKGCRERHCREEDQKGTVEAREGIRRQSIGLRNFREDRPQYGAHSDGRKDAPAESEDRGGFCMKQTRVGDSEVFDAQMSGDLIVDDAISNRGEETSQNDLRLVHLLGSAFFKTSAPASPLGHAGQD